MIKGKYPLPYAGRIVILNKEQANGVNLFI